MDNGNRQETPEERREKTLYEEYKILGPVGSWIVLLAFTLFVLTSGMFLHMLVGDKPLTWDFGALPDAPGESVYSDTRSQALKGFPPLLQKLPEARPLDPVGQGPSEGAPK